jgi:hypothetical protein
LFADAAFQSQHIFAARQPDAAWRSTGSIHYTTGASSVRPIRLAQFAGDADALVAAPRPDRNA